MKTAILAILFGALLTSCTGRTPDGKPCRKNFPALLPSTSTNMSGTCPQSTAYLTKPDAAEATKAP